MLSVENVSRRYDDAGGGELSVLRDVSLTLDAGRSLAILGASGSGKSTLLNLIGGLDQPNGGRVVLNSRVLSDCNADELARVRNEQVGFIFQLHHLLPQCTVLENVLVPTLMRGRAAAAAAGDRATQLLERVGLGDRLTHRPAQLSGGERQRVAVVRALINEPSLLLADEPTGALDHEHAVQLVDLLLELVQEQGVALVMVTHADDLAARCDRVCRLRGGALVDGAS